MRAPEQIAEALKGIVLLLLRGIRALKGRVLLMRALNGTIVLLLRLGGIRAHLKLMVMAAALVLGITEALLMVVTTTMMITAGPREGVSHLEFRTCGFCWKHGILPPILWFCKTWNNLERVYYNKF